MRRQRGAETGNPGQSLPIPPVPTHCASHLDPALDAQKRRDGLDGVVPAHLQLAVVHRAKASGKRRIILRVDSEPARNLPELAEDRLHQTAGWAIAFDDRH